MNQLLSVDRETRAIRVQSGACGPQLEAALKPHGFTLRHFPQSFEFSTVGGWVATRAGGHFATRYTHIDDYVQSGRFFASVRVNAVFALLLFFVFFTLFLPFCCE